MLNIFKSPITIYYISQYIKKHNNYIQTPVFIIIFFTYHNTNPLSIILMSNWQHLSMIRYQFFVVLKEPISDYWRQFNVGIWFCKDSMCMLFLNRGIDNTYHHRYCSRVCLYQELGRPSHNHQLQSSHKFLLEPLELLINSYCLQNHAERFLWWFFWWDGQIAEFMKETF